MDNSRASFLVRSGFFNKPFVNELLAHGYRVVAEEERAVSRYTYYDTREGALFQRRYLLRLDESSRMWQLLFKGRTVQEEDTEGNLSLSKLTGVKPLLPHLKAKVSGREYQLITPSESRLIFLFERWGFANPHSSGRYRYLYHLAVSAEQDEPSAPDAGAAEVSFIKPLLRDLFGLKVIRFEPLVLGLQKIERPLPGTPIPQRLTVRRSDSIVEACSKVLAKQAYKMWANTEGTILDLHPEYLHDLRVATRKARFALKMIEPLMNRERCENLRKELAWIARNLGNVRDIDVFLGALGVRFDRVGASEEVRNRISGSLEKRRSPALKTLRNSLEQARYTQILENLNSIQGQIIAGQSDRDSSTDERTPEALARESIGKGLKRVTRWLNWRPDELTTSELHRIRIDFKGLRYTCEFFSDFFGNDMHKMIELFVLYQDCLGTFNDVQVAEERLRSLADSFGNDDAARREIMLVLGSLIQIQRDEAEQQRTAFFDLWKKFPRTVCKLEKILGRLS